MLDLPLDIIFWLASQLVDDDILLIDALSVRLVSLCKTNSHFVTSFLIGCLGIISKYQ